jgi:hypothetical protein
MLLEDQNAVIYRAGRAIGGGVAKAFARDEARADALDEQAVEQHVRAGAAQAGSIEVFSSFISRGEVQGIALVDLATADSIVAATGARMPGSGSAA